MTCIFDIESVPDIELLKTIYDYKGSDIDICEQAFAYQECKSSSSFLPLCFHKIISISSLIVDDNDLKPLKIGNFGKTYNAESFKHINTHSNNINSTKNANLFIDSNNAQNLQEKTNENIESNDNKDSNNKFEDDYKLEEALISEFAKFLIKNPRLISFNGKGFDMPLIALRSIKYNISLHPYYEVNNISVNKNKWENYRQRYSENFHIDLFDMLSNYGQNRSINLDVICKMSGITGKYDINGADVYKLYYEKSDIKSINFYCQSDVINTYWLFLKFELTRGNLHIQDYISHLDALKSIMNRQAPYFEAFCHDIENEMKRVNLS